MIGSCCVYLSTVPNKRSKQCRLRRLCPCCSPHAGLFTDDRWPEQPRSLILDYFDCCDGTTSATQQFWRQQRQHQQHSAWWAGQAINAKDTHQGIHSQTSACHQQLGGFAVGRGCRLGGRPSKKGKRSHACSHHSAAANVHLHGLLWDTSAWQTPETGKHCLFEDSLCRR